MSRHTQPRTMSEAHGLLRPKGNTMNDRIFNVRVKVQRFESNVGPGYWATATCAEDSLHYPERERAVGREAQAPGNTPAVAAQRATDELLTSLLASWKDD